MLIEQLLAAARAAQAGHRFAWHVGISVVVAQLLAREDRPLRVQHDLAPPLVRDDLGVAVRVATVVDVAREGADGRSIADNVLVDTSGV